MFNANLNACPEAAPRRLYYGDEVFGPKTGATREPSTVQHGSAPRCGWGSCSKCPCAGFVQSYGNNICDRCGHSYTEHW
jgi:hypothetical protein